MNIAAVRILFLKDLFLSRRQLFGYFAGGLVSSMVACVPNPTLGFIGFILTITVAISAGIHLIGTLLLSESTDQTRAFVFSLPISLLDYSVGKMSVILTTYLLPWSAMFAITTIATFALPWGKNGAVVVLPGIFLFLLCGFTIQLATAVLSGSIGCTIGVMVGCNVALNVFLMKYFMHPEIMEVRNSDVLTWPSVAVQTHLIECVLIIVSLVVAFVMQTRKRDLV